MSTYVIYVIPSYRLISLFFIDSYEETDIRAEVAAGHAKNRANTRN